MKEFEWYGIRADDKKYEIGGKMILKMVASSIKSLVFGMAVNLMEHVPLTALMI